MHALLDVAKQVYSGCQDGSCPCGLRFAPQDGWIPRGIMTDASSFPEIRAIVVGKNPGHVIPHEAAAYAKCASNDALIEAQRGFLREFMTTPLRGSNGNYQRNLVAVLKACLGVETVPEILRVTYFTQAVKCSTPDNEQKKLPVRVVKACNVYLKAELAALPKVPVIALGREAENAVRLATNADRVIYLHHPSWGARNRDEAVRRFRAA